jgi:chromosome condensin MukBEF ATPase and DNA-binding subunit MukB
MELGLGLALSKESRENIQEGIAKTNELITAIENMDVPLSEIFAKLGESTGQTAVEIERKMRIGFAEKMRETIVIMEALVDITKEE